jgi:citrate synthase
LSFNC